MYIHIYIYIYIYTHTYYIYIYTYVHVLVGACLAPSDIIVIPAQHQHHGWLSVSSS